LWSFVLRSNFAVRDSGCVFKLNEHLKRGEKWRCKKGMANGRKEEWANEWKEERKEERHRTWLSISLVAWVQRSL
jgi:hypothetical protein